MRGALLALALACAAASASAQEIALTFDDLPAHGALPPGETRLGVIARIVAALDEAGAPPSHGFVNGAQVDREPRLAAVLRLWRAAGHRLGNHTWSHMRLEDGKLDAFAADVAANEPLLAREMAGGDWRWFRYPYLAEGEAPETRAAARTFLAERGYRIASVTLSFDDYAWNAPYARCRAKGDAAAIAGLEASYLAAAEASLDHARSLSRTLHGGDIPYVLLLHAGAFDARMLPRLLALYRAKGVRFVTLEAAQADPFYRDDTAMGASAAPTTLDSAMTARGLPIPPRRWSTAELHLVCP
jgi:peptidoglycan-N-acetylglucosamine deacetylase